MPPLPGRKTCASGLLVLAALIGLSFGRPTVGHWAATAAGLTASARADSALAHDDLPFYDAAHLRPGWGWLAGWHRVGPLRLQESSGTWLDDAYLERGPTVIGFFYGGCVSACPISLLLLSQARQKLVELGEPAPQFLSVTVSPLSDSPPVLQDMASRLALPASWKLATGSPADIDRLARDGLFSDVLTPALDGLPAHVDRIFLVDRYRRIRGIYSAVSAAEMSRLVSDLRRLVIQDGSQGKGEAGPTLTSTGQQRVARFGLPVLSD